jgi:DNA-binding transcriptional ArsR family regulator
MKGMIQLCKCLSEPIAVRVVMLLLQGELRMNQIERILLTNRSTINLHLTKLRDCNLVLAEQEGRWLRFRINDEARPLLESIVAQYESDISWDPRVTEDLVRLQREKWIIDPRSPQSAEKSE